MLIDGHDVRVITVATHVHGMYNDLINNKNNIPIVTLGFGEKWTGFQMKPEKTLEYINKEKLKDTDIIIFLDGFDSITNGTVENAINKFKIMNCKVLASIESPKKTNISNFLHRRTFGYNIGDFVINSGLYMGYVKELKILLSDMLKMKCGDDQINFNTVSKKHDFVKIDVEKIVFENITKHIDEEINLTNNNGIFVSFPATLTTDRMLRAPKEYGQFFVKEIFIIFAIICAFLLHKGKKKYAIIVICIFIMLYAYIDKSCIDPIIDINI